MCARSLIFTLVLFCTTIFSYTCARSMYDYYRPPQYPYYNPVPYRAYNAYEEPYRNPYNLNRMPASLRQRSANDVKLLGAIQGNGKFSKIPLLGFRNGAIIDYEYIYDVDDITKPKSSSVTILNVGHTSNSVPEKHNLADVVSVRTLISQGNDVEFKTVPRQRPEEYIPEETVTIPEEEQITERLYSFTSQPHRMPTYDTNNYESSNKIFTPVSDNVTYKPIPTLPPIKDDYEEEAYEDYEDDEDIVDANFGTSTDKIKNLTEESQSTTAKSFWWG